MPRPHLWIIPRSIYFCSILAVIRAGRSSPRRTMPPLLRKNSLTGAGIVISQKYTLAWNMCVLLEHLREHDKSKVWSHQNHAGRRYRPEVEEDIRGKKWKEIVFPWNQEAFVMNNLRNISSKASIFNPVNSLLITYNQWFEASNPSLSAINFPPQCIRNEYIAVFVCRGMGKKWGNYFHHYWSR